MSKTAELTTTKQTPLAEARPERSFVNRYLHSDLTYNGLSLGIFLVLWSLLAAIAKSPFVPSPAQVWDAFVQLYQVGDVEGYTLKEHISMSIVRILSGFGLAAAMGIPLGLLMGLNPKIYDRTRSIIEPIRFIPPIAWIPLSIVILMGFSRYVFLIWLGAFFPIWINTLVSVPRVNPVYLNVGRVFGGDKWLRIRKVVIPSVLPDITSGMRVGLGMAWMCIVAAEMIGGEGVGVGRLILKYAELLRLPEVVVGMLIIGVIGFAMNEIILRFEKWMFKWRWEVSI
ncbi:ABC transporter permease [Desulfomonile tiedjei]|uniref:ABC-type nitrate/sulfonate/bicarbonate transport system, permease component n=1 Tax=Desulfomonile tiedjei (strain ATCC 49306 / DSM 6799 / DCB-1) TaxID=706587 RepID=I4CDZ6_DESTA|nr:ABC transporter permease [Desulfomonile tiedjei]AFM27787.1 ABC-type nitrate/sulfonate/bicarbonate transport system, permease component [Desulfomonile tiedjei DSM 6799]